jgi:hypothetical protein
MMTLFFGCFKPESPHLIEDTFSIQLEFDQNIRAQYLDLTERRIVTAIAPVPWHVRFACNTNDFRVEINSAAGIAGHRVSNLAYEAVDQTYPVDKIIWDYDLPDGSISSTVVGAWGDFSFPEPKSLNDIVLLKIPINNDELILKLQIMGVENERYQIQTSLLDNSVRDTFYVSRNTNSNYRYINLLERVDIEFEPPASNWDLVFTHFVDTTIDGMAPDNPFVEQLNSYLATYPGLLSNSTEVEWVRTNRSIAPDSVHFQLAQGQSFRDQTGVMDAQSMKLTQSGKPFLNQKHGYFFKKQSDDQYFYIQIDEYHIETTGKGRVSLTIKSL